MRWVLGGELVCLHSGKQSLGRTQLHAAMPCLLVSRNENAMVAIPARAALLRHCKAAQLVVPRPPRYTPMLTLNFVVV